MGGSDESEASTSRDEGPRRLHTRPRGGDKTSVQFYVFDAPLQGRTTCALILLWLWDPVKTMKTRTRASDAPLLLILNFGASSASYFRNYTVSS